MPRQRRVNRTSKRTLRSLQLEEQALQLRCLGKPYTEISLQIGISRSTAHDLVRRAKLRQLERNEQHAATLRALELRRLELMHGPDGVSRRHLMHISG